jgi:hypothetical protein
MTRLLATAILVCASAVALAQLRSVPANSTRAVMSHLQDMVVRVDGKQARLSPGAQVRDIHNRLILPTAIPPGSVVKFQANAQGHIFRVWILTPQEAAQSAPPKPAPKPVPLAVPAK